jgi:hypothetical protein
MASLPEKILRRGRRFVEQRITSPILAKVSPGPRMVMFHTGRCGSTVLADCISQHPRFFWDGELYRRNIIQLDRKGGRRHTIETDAGAFDAMVELRPRLAEAGARIYGVEVKFFHLDFAGADMASYLEQLKQLDFGHFVVLRRKNFLRTIVSSIAARETGYYHRQKKGAALVSIHIDVESVDIDRRDQPLLDHLEGYRQNFDSLLYLLQLESVLELTYEDDIMNDPVEGYRRVCRFMNEQVHDVSINYHQVNPYPLNERVSNYEEVAEYLADTPFEWMLKD